MDLTKLRITKKEKINVDSLVTNKLAVIYTRVSTREQAMTNCSLETQLKICENIAKTNNLNIEATFGNTFESAKTDSRKEFLRMLEFISSFNKKNKSKKITGIIVSSIDRFSRSGGGAIAILEELWTNNIKLISGNFNNSDRDEDKFSMKMGLIFAEFDNARRKKVSISGTINLLNKGGWPTKAPLGYDKTEKDGTGVKKAVINEIGQFVKRAFELKYYDRMSNMDIKKWLEKRGIKLTPQKLNEIFKNPFYCGVIDHSFLDKPILGKIEPMISPEQFFELRERDKKFLKAPNEKEDESFPLRSTIKCLKCGCKMTAYHVVKKNAKYYKCNTVGCKVNVNSDIIHALFIDELKKLSIDKELIPALKLQIALTYKRINGSNEEKCREIKHQVKVIEHKLEIAEERFVLGEIPKDSYQKVTAKLQQNLKELNQEFEASNKTISNLEKYIDLGIDLMEKISLLWSKSTFRAKIMLQRLVYPEGISFDKTENRYRTIITNEFFNIKSLFSIDYREEIQELPLLDIDNSCLVVVKIINANIEEAMETTLKGLPLYYAISGRTISIKKPDKAMVTAARQQMITITGTVMNENGIPMAGVSVSSAKVKSIYTDGQGKFTLKDIDALATVRISFTGYATIERTALAISLLSEIHLQTEAINLNPTLIQGQRTKETALSNKVDLRNRGHLTLAFVLESTIPGLVLRKQRNTTKQEVFRNDGSNPFVPAGDYTFEEYLQVMLKAYRGLGLPIDMAALRQSIENVFADGRKNGRVISLTSNESSNIIPELRGPGGFGANNNAMLVVIDGFVQSSFPADYPLNNVLSIEVIRDPAETIKWGPGAANGVIVITTNGGKPGVLQITYNSTFNFSGAPNNSAAALQRANTSQMLDYYLDENKAIPATFTRPDPNMASLVPARILLEKRYRKQITADEFQSQWNLLSQLSNEEQYRQQQQGIFSQNQNLNLSGGGKHHRFSLNGNYSTFQSEALGNSNRSWGLNFRDQLSLMDNKLQIALQLNANLDRRVAGKALNPAELDPYQMLYRPDGSYVYDYNKSALNEYRNQQLKTSYPGLLDYGYNPLEEARGTHDLSKGHSLNSSLNVSWKLFEGFTWSSNLQYTNTSMTTERLWKANTQYVRGQYNSYYAVSKMNELLPGFFVPEALNPRVAYLPLGDTFQHSKSRGNLGNLRSGFNYSRVFEQKHAFNMGLGFAYFNRFNRFNTDLPLYGYNSGTGLGTGLSLPATEQSYNNALGLINFNRLTAVLPMVRQPDRNFSANAALDYTYDGRLGLQAFYNESFMPIPTAKVYSSTRNYNALAFWALHKESFFKVPLISKLKLAAGLGEIKMASLPVNLPATRTFQSNWETTALLVTGYNAVRQNGEQIRNYDALLDMGLFKDVLQAQLNYRYNSMGVKNQLSGRVSYHISKANYFNLPWVSNLMVEGLVSNISPAQALAQMMSTNSPLSGGGFSTATSNFNLGSLPQHIVNREISLRLGLWKDQLNLDARYYNRSTSGLVNGFFQADVSTGFSERPLYSRMDNKGYELYVQAKILQGDGFNWTSTVNVAYNLNLVKDVVKPLFSLNTGYLTADRSGYARGSLWSYRWAGLDNQGNPQVYNPEGGKVKIESNANSLEKANEHWVAYSGRTTPPWSGAFIQEFGYKGFYARATLRFALGHVMRTYRPVMSAYETEKSSLIANRWRKPGDEALTDIPAIGMYYSFAGARKLTVQNSSNSIAPADFFRLSELQFGYDVPVNWLKGKMVKSLNLALNLQNVALWTRNKLGIDPEAILPTGELLVRQPLRYGISLNVGL